MIGQRIRKCRKLKGWTQKQLADKIYGSIPLISHYENNYKSPSIKKLKLLCQAFNVSADYLLELEG